MSGKKRNLHLEYETLYKMHHINGLTFNEIKKNFKTSHRVLSRHFKQFGIPIKKSSEYKIKEIPGLDKDVLNYLYNELNLSIVKIAKLNNLSESAIQTKFKSFGIIKRSSGESRSKFFRDKFPYEILKDFYETNENVHQIAEILDLPAHSVYHALRGYGLMRTRQDYFKDKIQKNDSVNPNFFKVMSKELAYVLGLLLTDGCLSKKNGVSLELIDEDVINWVAETIAYKHPVRKRFRNNKWNYKIQFRNQEAIKELTKLGLTYRKSLIINCPDIRTEFRADFIRGVFEGDGSVGPKKNNYITIFSGSEDFIKMIKRYVEEMIGGDIKYYKCTYKRKNPLYFYKRCALKDIITFGEIIYKNCPYGMERKKRIFKEKYGVGIY